MYLSFNTLTKLRLPFETVEKKMKTYLKLLLSLSLSICVVACSANDGTSPLKNGQNNLKLYGGVDGGGGKGVECGGRISTLDLFEANQSGLTPIDKGNDLNENLKYFGIELAKHFSESISDINNPEYPNYILKEMQTNIIQKFKDISSGTHLKETIDATLPEIPIGCRFVQIVIYNDHDSVIYRDLEYWNKMSVLDQAALILHEWIYRRARLSGSSTSDETRKVVGQIFSAKNPEPLLSPIWNAKKKIWCGGGIEGTDQEVYEFFGIDEVQDGKNGTSLYFRVFKGNSLTTRLNAFIPNLSLDQFMNRQFIYLSTFATQHAISKEWLLEMQTQSGTSFFQMRSSTENSKKTSFSNVLCKWE